MATHKQQEIHTEFYKLSSIIACLFEQNGAKDKRVSEIQILWSYFIDQVKQLCFCGVHAHRPHGIAKLPGVDRPPSVHVELVERLLQLGDLLLAQRVCHV